MTRSQRGRGHDGTTVNTATAQRAETAATIGPRRTKRAASAGGTAAPAAAKPTNTTSQKAGVAAGKAAARRRHRRTRRTRGMPAGAAAESPRSEQPGREVLDQVSPDAPPVRVHNVASVARPTMPREAPRRLRAPGRAARRRRTRQDATHKQHLDVQVAPHHDQRNRPPEWRDLSTGITRSMTSVQAARAANETRCGLGIARGSRTSPAEQHRPRQPPVRARGGRVSEAQRRCQDRPASSERRCRRRPTRDTSRHRRASSRRAAGNRDDETEVVQTIFPARVSRPWARCHQRSGS